MDMTPRVWPAGRPEIPPLVAFAYLTLTPILAVFLSQRASSSLRTMLKWPLVKILVVLVLLDSFLFIWTSGILILGVGTSASDVSCAVGIWWCIGIYASSKIFIYLFLMERVHLVYSISHKTRLSRWRSPWYRASFLFMLAWIGVALAMIVGRISEIRERDGACIIGLKLFATVPMLTVDVLVNIFLTTAFVVPIYRSKFNKAQRLARNSSIAAVVALASSFTNIAILAVQHGHQLSWVCLGSCGLDVTINSCIIFFITSVSSDDIDSEPMSGSVVPHHGTNQSFAKRVSVGRGGPTCSNTSGGILVSSETVRSIDRSIDFPVPSLRKCSLTDLSMTRRQSNVPFRPTRIDFLGSPTFVDSEPPEMGEVMVVDFQRAEVPRVVDYDLIEESPREADRYDDEEKKLESIA